MLSDSAIKAAKPREKDYKIQDERGMYLLVYKNGGKYFRFNYRFEGKRLTLALGVYPDTSLKQAREARDEARRLLAGGINPAVKKVKKHNTFSEVFEEWIGTNLSWSDKYRQDVRDRARINLLPIIGNMDIQAITHDHLIIVINRLKTKGIHSKSVSKIYAYINSVYRLAIAKRLCDRNLAEDVKALLPTGSEVKPRPCLSEDELPLFAEKLSSYSGRYETRVALKLLLLSATRPQETFAAQWSEFDLAKGLWTIPIERMKLRRVHVVPLPVQVIEELGVLKGVSSHSPYLFPNQQYPMRHMSENTLNLAIKKQLGFESTAHGLRATFSTVMNRLGYRADVIEVCLAHVDSTVRGIYNRTDYFEERKTLMQAWADYIFPR